MQEQPNDFSHLNLTGWPFQKVPDEAFACIWADRTELKKQVDRLIWRWPRTDRGFLQLMWADLGSGKTHTLMHIYQHCVNRTDLGILPILVVMPREIRSFLDVYQAVTASLDLDELANMFAHACRSAGSTKAAASDLFPFIPDASTILRKMQSDDESMQRLAKAWFTGTRGMTRGQLNRLEVSRAIRTTDDCVAMLRGIVRLIPAASKYRRVLIMIDECQRMWRFRASISRDIDTGLQTWYDSSHKHLTLLLSFRCGYEKYVYELISEDLRSRSDPPNISLPLLTRDEAINFVRDLLDFFRADGAPSPWFPFAESMVKSIVEHITKREGVSPRQIMTVFHALLEEADYQIESSGQFVLDIDSALRLVDGAIQTPDEDEEE